MATVRPPMTMVAFMQASNVTVYSASWRYPSSRRDFLTMDYYQEVGRELERGMFDMLFFDDRLAMPGIHGGGVGSAVASGARPVKLDLLTILGTVAAATRDIGLGATYSTTYYEPYHVARIFATLDHLSRGRAAWNVVTSVNDSEAENFGVDLHLLPEDRYARAEEFMEATFRLWDSWGDDAIVYDRDTGVFGRPEAVREVNYQGEFVKTRGPLSVPRTPQGRPVVIQAGQSGRGRDFAARWADLIFTIANTLPAARAHYDDQKERIAQLGRDPDSVKILPLVFTVVGETEQIARDKETMLLNMIDPSASLALLSEAANYDFAAHELDEPVTEELLGRMTGARGMIEGILRHVGRENATIRDLADHRSTLLEGPRFVGTGAQVADQLEEWYLTQGCDGFAFAATHVPGAFEEFTRMVVPELQRRGLARTSYTGGTLRENLGIERPSAEKALPAAR